MNTVTVEKGLAPYLPDWYRRIEDYNQIIGAEEKLFDVAAGALTSVHENFYVSSMNEAGVAEWESTFGIVPDTATEALDFRRARVLNRLGLRPPYTVEFLRGRLDELIGPGEFTIEVNPQTYTLIVESSAENQQYAIEVSYTVNKTKPAHIIYINRPYLRSTMLMNEEISTARRVYNYRLGAWGLGLEPFASTQEMGVIKMATTPSIQEALLSDAAGFVLDDIASARINGSIGITALEKSVTGSKLTVTYNVRPEQTAEITKAELLRADGTVLSAATIYVPVIQPTAMKHVIQVQEGVNA